ncbi:MAG: (2Fe-2S) ferredoxin domain-containing protein [Candidatus Gracilibacteria bacterium]|nr:(2Fe-2S) ferredoxin domain-containing protein [Candidatus Gracilibacteria bacterium]
MKIQVCTGKSCKLKFSEYIIKRISQDKEKFNLHNITLETCPCQGRCKEGPIVLVDGKAEIYSDPIKISKMIFDKINGRKHKQEDLGDKETN